MSSTEAHTHTQQIHQPESQSGLALFDMLYSKIINIKSMKLKTLQMAVNYDPRRDDF